MGEKVKDLFEDDSSSGSGDLQDTGPTGANIEHGNQSSDLGAIAQEGDIDITPSPSDMPNPSDMPTVLDRPTTSDMPNGTFGASDSGGGVDQALKDFINESNSVRADANRRAELIAAAARFQGPSLFDLLEQPQTSVRAWGRK